MDAKKKKPKSASQEHSAESSSDTQDSSSSSSDEDEEETGKKGKTPTKVISKQTKTVNGKKGGAKKQRTGDTKKAASLPSAQTSKKTN